MARRRPTPRSGASAPDDECAGQRRRLVFLRYIAASARARSSSIPAVWLSWEAPPALTETVSGRPLMATGSVIDLVDAVDEPVDASIVVVLDDDHELVAADPSDGVRGAGDGSEPAGDLDEDVVTGGVTEVVVDGLEPVDVDVDHADGARPALRAGDGVLEPVTEQRAVRQPGERVVGGEVVQLGACLGEGRDV